MSSKFHPAVVPICLLLAILGTFSVGYATYRHFKQNAPKKEMVRSFNPLTNKIEEVEYKAPVWKTREVYKDGKYVQEKYRDFTEQDRERALKDLEYLYKGRL